MKTTNKFNLPEPILKAVENDPYTGGDTLSATRLIGPPLIRKLTRDHWDEIVEDVSEKIWILIGQAVHTILERAVGEDDISERRLFTIVDGELISGQFDLLEKSKTLSDFKVTSVWAAKGDPKIDWITQLNVLAFLARRNGLEVSKLQIIAILRDWRKNELQRYGGDYPRQQVVAIPIPLWSPDKAREYVRERIKTHHDPDPPICNPEERWDKPTTYAVMKTGRKSAVKLFDHKENADTFMYAHADAKKMYVDIRFGSSPRCEQYCSVNQWCPRWIESQKEKGLEIKGEIKAEIKAAEKEQL